MVAASESGHTAPPHGAAQKPERQIERGVKELPSSHTLPTHPLRYRTPRQLHTVPLRRIAPLYTGTAMGWAAAEVRGVAAAGEAEAVGAVTAAPAELFLLGIGLTIAADFAVLIALLPALRSAAEALLSVQIPAALVVRLLHVCAVDGAGAVVGTCLSASTTTNPVVRRTAVALSAAVAVLLGSANRTIHRRGEGVFSAQRSANRCK
eukprot:gene5426-6722_t